MIMAKNETLHIRVNEAIKSQAENTLGMLGVSISDAVNMLLHQIILVGGLPFNVRVPLAPDSLVVSSKEELYNKLDAGKKQIQEGKVVDAKTALAKTRNTYGY
jgi:addiction module RelB/DinJ family antitoxin